MVIVLSFARERKTAPSDYAPGLRDPSGSKPFKTEWQNIIKEKWLILKKSFLNYKTIFSDMYLLNSYA